MFGHDPPRRRVLTLRHTVPRLLELATPIFWLLLVVSSPHAQTRPYVLQDLGVLPGDASSIAWGINSRGEVVGWSGITPTRAFLYRDGVGMVELTPLPGHTYALARGINDAGVVVGSGWGPGIPEHALRWTGNLVEDLGVLDGSSEGFDINEAGVTVGSSPTRDNFVRHAFMHTDAGGMVDIAPAWNASAFDINEVGQIAGSASVGAFLWSPGTGLQPLGTVDGFAFGHGMAVNISGQVAGFATSASGNVERVFRYTDGLGLVDLGGVGETNVVWGMNARGEFVGEGRPSSGLKRAFVYTDEGGLQALNDLIDASPQWFLLLASDINDAGQIVGYGFDNVTGQTRAFRLSPVVPVGPLAHLALSPVRLVGGSSATGWVTLTEPAPAGGASVTLASDVPTLAEVPPSVLVAEGQRHASFPVVTTKPASASTVGLIASYAGQTRSASLAVDPDLVTGVGPGPEAGPALRLLPPYPNPAGTEARIRIVFARSADAEIRVHDVHGRLVRAFRLAGRPGGTSELVWDLRNASGALVGPGVYHLELAAGGERAVTRIVVLPD